MKMNGKAEPRRLSWTGQSRAAFESQYLTDSFYLYHSFSVIVAQPLSSMFGGKEIRLSSVTIKRKVSLAENIHRINLRYPYDILKAVKVKKHIRNIKN